MINSIVLSLETATVCVCNCMSELTMIVKMCVHMSLVNKYLISRELYSIYCHDIMIENLIPPYV